MSAPLLAPSRVFQSPEPMQLVPRPRGSLHSLAQQAVQSSLGGSLVLGPGECQLRVMCIGLNFRDVLNVLGMYPGDPGMPGGDCSGVVAAVGARAAHVPALHVGQAVLGLAGGSLGTYVAAFQDMAVPMPTSLSFEQAATAPTVFVTVELALHRASAVHAGDNVLVHGGTGAKRSFLRGVGVQEVVSSRDTRFVSGGAAWAGGAGMVAATVAGLQEGGRMV